MILENESASTTQRRPTIWASALLISMLALGACATGQDITETSPEAGNPLRVASDVCVQVTDQLSAQTPAGGLQTKKCIQGWVVMTRTAYDKMMAERASALASVSRAETAVIEAQRKQTGDALKEQIVYILAQRCREDAACYAAAKPHIAAAMGLK